MSKPSVWTRLLRWLGLGPAPIPLPELRAKYETEQSQYVEVDGTRVHYRIEGEGPTLVLLHGVLAQLQTWDGWVTLLRAHYKLIRIDVPGFGLTGPIATGTYTPQYAVELFEKLRIALGEEKFHIAGNSLGGFLAWFYASTHPARVDKLVLIDPLSYPQRMPKLIWFTTLPLIRWFVPLIAPRPFIAAGVKEVYGDPTKFSDETVDRYHELLLREGNREAMLQFFDLAGEHFHQSMQSGLWDRIATLPQRVLLLWGEQDRWIPVSHVQRWKTDLPSIETKIYPSAGHIPMEELPEETARDAHAFLSR